VPRSTRDKIKDKRRQCYESVERLFSNLQDIESICDGNSEYVTAVFPVLFTAVGQFDDMLRSVLKKL